VNAFEIRQQLIDDYATYLLFGGASAGDGLCGDAPYFDATARQGKVILVTPP